jgi:hypothetical protein
LNVIKIFLWSLRNKRNQQISPAAYEHICKGESRQESTIAKEDHYEQKINQENGGAINKTCERQTGIRRQGSEAPTVINKITMDT